MFKIYKTLDEFVEALKIEDKETTEICMTIIPHRDNNVLTCEILMQFIDKTNKNLVHTHHYFENLRSVKILSAGAFNVIPDQKLREAQEDAYNEMLNQFDASVNTEYQKAKDFFRGTMGFKKISDSHYV